MENNRSDAEASTAAGELFDSEENEAIQMGSHKRKSLDRFTRNEQKQSRNSNNSFYSASQGLVKPREFCD